MAGLASELHPNCSASCLVTSLSEVSREDQRAELLHELPEDQRQLIGRGDMTVSRGDADSASTAARRGCGMGAAVDHHTTNLRNFHMVETAKMVNRTFFKKSVVFHIVLTCAYT